MVGEASDGLEAIAESHRTRSEVVLMDVRMPHLDGIGATRRITADRTLAATRVLVLTTFELDENVFEALREAPAGSCRRASNPTTCAGRLRSWPRASPSCHPR